MAKTGRSKWDAIVVGIVSGPGMGGMSAGADVTAQWGDFGGRPHKASFAMHALILGCYLQSGAWFPVGGGKRRSEDLQSDEGVVPLTPRSRRSLIMPLDSGHRGGFISGFAIEFGAAA